MWHCECTIEMEHVLRSRKAKGYLFRVSVNPSKDGSTKSSLSGAHGFNFSRRITIVSSFFMCVLVHLKLLQCTNVFWWWCQYYLYSVHKYTEAT
jgi:hypothetical protein